MKQYEVYIQLDDSNFKPVSQVVIRDKLPPGMYEVNANMRGEVYFTKIKNNHDGLIDLPGTEYEQVVSEIELFMQPETRAVFEEWEYIYKRSTLLYGPPGTGKTCIVNRIANSVMAKDGVVLFSPNPKLLEEAFKILDSTQPETRVMVIFEEVDQLVARYESELLNLLDGEIQKSNIIFVSTTNYIEKVPARVRRPGRTSTVLKVGFPTDETRRYYLEHKFKGRSTGHSLDAWVSKTKGFSIDELKETVLAVICLQQDLDKVIARIKENKGQKVQKEEVPEDDDVCYADEYETKEDAPVLL